MVVRGFDELWSGVLKDGGSWCSFPPLLPLGRGNFQFGVPGVLCISDSPTSSSRVKSAIDPWWDLFPKGWQTFGGNLNLS